MVSWHVLNLTYEVVAYKKEKTIKEGKINKKNSSVTSENPENITWM